jgi:hypothetical protein
MRPGHVPLTSALGLLALSLPGCVTRALWSDDTSKVAAMQRMEFLVAAVGSWNVEAADGAAAPCVVICVDARGGGPASTPNEPTEPVQLLLFPTDVPTRDAIVTLLTEQPIGPLDRRVLEVHWTRSPLGEVIATADVDLGGEIAAGLIQQLDGSAAAALMASPRTVPRARLLADGNRAQVEAAERVDWRLVLPFDPEGRGEVLAGVRNDGASDGGLDLLVRVGDRDHGQVVRVPARVTPMLGSLWRDSVLYDRYRLQATCRAAVPMLQVPVVHTAPCKQATTLALTSSVETMEPRIILPVKVLLTPFAATADVLLWFLRHGPLDEAALHPPDPNAGPIQASKPEKR